MKVYLACLAHYLISITAIAQHPNMLISNTENPNEISIALDPNDPMKMMAAANIRGVYTSDDGGLTWSEKLQASPLGVWGDPVVVIDTAGVYYHFHLSKVPGAPFIDRIVCQKSIDGGLSFNDGTSTGKNGKKAQDKHWAVVDRESNAIHLAWTQFDKYDSRDPKDKSNIMHSRSDDQGESWSEPVQINRLSGDCRDSSNTVEGAVPAVGPNGEVYVAWAGPAGLVFNSSTDGGKTWSAEETLIDSMSGGWSLEIPGIYRANGFAVTKCDLSQGPQRGTIYVNWSDQSSGVHDTNIWLSKSRDGGKTWSTRSRVNGDSSQTHQFYNWLDIDQTTGYLYVIYYDRSRYTDTKTDVVLAVSRDGGNSFKAHTISEEAFVPDSAVFFGDYSNVAAHAGLIRPVWTAMNNGKTSVLTAIIDYDMILSENNMIAPLTYDSSSGELTTMLKLDATGSLSIEKSGEQICEWKKLEWQADQALTFGVPLQLATGIYRVKFELNKSAPVYRQLVVLP